MSTIRMFWRLLNYQRWRFMGSLGSNLSFYGGRLVFGLIMQGFFNALPIHKQADPFLWGWIALMVLAALLRGILTYGSAWIFVGISFILTALLQRNLLERVLERPGARAVPGSPGEAISRLRDDTAAVVRLNDVLAGAFPLFVFTVIALIILFRLNAMITLLVFLPAVGTIVLAQRMRKRLVTYRRASSQATSELTSAIGEIFGAVQAIQVAGAEPDVVTHFDSLNEQRRILILRDVVFGNVLKSLFGNIIGIGTGLILVIMALSLHSTHLGVGDLSLFIYYLSTVTDFVQAVGNLLTAYAQTTVAHERLVKLLQGAPPERLIEHKPLYILGPEPPAIPFIERSRDHGFATLEAHGLTYHYPDTGRGIDDISLRLTQGSVVVVTGRIGSGKTTLLQVLLGLLPRDAGTIVWDGEPVADPASFFVPPRSAYTAQVPHLFSDPLKENILLGLPEHKADLQHAVHAAVMEHDVEHLEHGLDTLIGTRGVKLSGGQAQRTAAARMLVRDPELLVFDDLSSALDVETEQLLWERLFAAERRTCLVVSHRRSVLQRADHILLLKGGRLEAEGDLETLLRTSEEMQRLWHGDFADAEDESAPEEVSS